MKPGNRVESAIWLAGTEDDQMIQAFKDRARSQSDQKAKQHNVVVGPFIWTIKRPGDDRVPSVPDGISGVDVRLLVGEADIFPGKPTIISNQPGFVHDLTNEDIARLRKLTRCAHQKVQPGSKLNDQQCDAIIEKLGPDAALRTLRDGANT